MKDRDKAVSVLKFETSSKNLLDCEVIEDFLIDFRAS